MIEKSRDELLRKFTQVRKETIQICENLEIEDYVVQPCPEVSPPKWHLGHTTWFFEELILKRHSKSFSRFNKDYSVLFNSYYKSAGKHWLQADRGTLSRPTVEKIQTYRNYVNEEITNLLSTTEPSQEISSLIELGLHHEQQHQELLYMDIKYILGVNPTPPTYFSHPLPRAKKIPNSWEIFEEGLYEIGHGNLNFSYDNEKPIHKSYLSAFKIRENLVTDGEFLEFINDSGYLNPTHWLSEGWDWVNAHSIKSPPYWYREDKKWFQFTLHGSKELDLNAPLTHISYFEADAFASWAGLRLPTEQEIEIFLRKSPTPEHENSHIHHPYHAGERTGQVWCWTKSHYSSYPGFIKYKGTLGEYNAKFMCNQFVLRGGCIATPRGHYRHTYRNFYGPHQRWMFSGIRVAKDI